MSPLLMPERTPITRAAGILAHEHRLCAAAVACDGALLGVISAEPIMRWLARADGGLI